MRASEVSGRIRASGSVASSWMVFGGPGLWEVFPKVVCCLVVRGRTVVLACSSGRRCCCFAAWRSAVRASRDGGGETRGSRRACGRAVTAVAAVGRTAGCSQDGQRPRRCPWRGASAPYCSAPVPGAHWSSSRRRCGRGVQIRRRVGELDVPAVGHQGQAPLGVNGHTSWGLRHACCLMAVRNLFVGT